ncbi:MAG: hypothetical protein COS84_08080 [Armatimonadetes bacterium CG07_land_8_20_14_0_80_40_9]|nr:MAG: hypothetical protein COS84_08080 [Armatimonadetes bacterium CG07_land_8_20_14_0_80_40_9]
MLSEMTSQDVKIEFNPFQDVFASGSREEISESEILGRWFLSFRGKPFEKPFFAIPNLSPILQIDYSSSIYQSLEFKNETALTEEFFRKVEQIKVLEKVSRICDKLILEEKFLRKIDKKKLLKTISEILNEIPPEQLKIPEDELFKRIRGVLVLESISGTLNELTSGQIKDFDEAVKRRTLFK